MASALVPLKKYPEMAEFELLSCGELADYRYEIRANGKYRDRNIPFSFFCFSKDSANPCLVIADEHIDLPLASRMLTLYTQFGYAVRMCEPGAAAFSAECLEIAAQYIKNPMSFREEKEEADRFAALEDYPIIFNGKIVATGNIGSFRYELHLVDEPKNSKGYSQLFYVYGPHVEHPIIVLSLQRLFKSFRICLFAKQEQHDVSHQFQLQHSADFKKAAYRHIKKLLLDEEDLPSQLSELPKLQDSNLIITGNMGVFRCELHTDCKFESNIKYIHAFYFYKGQAAKPSFAVVLEKHPKTPRPTMVLFFDDQRMEFGYDAEMLDPKIFRDRSISLVQLVMLRENKNHVHVTSSDIEKLLKLDNAYTLAGAVLFLLSLVWLASIVVAVDSWVFVGYTFLGLRWLLFAGFVGLYFHMLRLVEYSVLHAALRSMLLWVPGLNVLLAYLAFRAAHQKLNTYGLEVHWTGLSYETSQDLQARLFADKNSP